MTTPSKSVLSITVIVAALGYFVDIYDLLLFSIIRVPSLESFGLSSDLIKTEGESIITWQMMGLLLGGILWGIMGDKKGRMSVLFGSILLYSVANLLNGFVQDVQQYKWVRFIAGIGLAGELGAGITLVSEVVSKERRGIVTSLVAGIGLTGAVFAFVIKEHFEWRTCYFIGAAMGFLLLLLRVSVLESGLFNNLKESQTTRGDISMLFFNRKRLKRYLLNMLIGLPTWLVIGMLITFSKEFGSCMNIKDKIDPGKAIMYAYVMISIGDIAIGFISHWFKSRKAALLLFYLITVFFMVLFFTAQHNGSANNMYWICAGLGLGTGFWAIFVTMAAEQFGTNLRATATTTIPNMVRGMLAVFILPLRDAFEHFLHLDYYTSGWATCLVVMALSFFALIFVEETYGKDLNFVEMD
jgi:putative MFS transporter